MNLLKSILGSSNSKRFTAPEAKAYLDANPSTFILDVREPEEYRMGHIAGARLIPLDDLMERVNELPKDKEILCVCASGSRSGYATQQLSEVGYQVINLWGGMLGWQRAGYPIKRGK